VKDENERALKNGILEAQVEASFQGHNLGPFEDVTDRITGGHDHVVVSVARVEVLASMAYTFRS
jgi:hypothetical protein